MVPWSWLCGWCGLPHLFPPGQEGRAGVSLCPMGEVGKAKPTAVPHAPSTAPSCHVLIMPTFLHPLRQSDHCSDSHEDSTQEIKGCFRGPIPHPWGARPLRGQLDRTDVPTSISGWGLILCHLWKQPGSPAGVHLTPPVPLIPLSVSLPILSFSAFATPSLALSVFLLLPVSLSLPVSPPTLPLSVSLCVYLFLSLCLCLSVSLPISHP